MSNPRFRLSRHAHARLVELDHLLDEIYRAPEDELQNKQDPLEEAVYIILSFQTDLERFKLVWNQLRQAFPTWDSLCRAPFRRVIRVLRVGGLQIQKAKTLRNLLKAVKDLTGEYSLRLLENLADAEAERILTDLPGLSWKGARCILLYSLDRPTFPVDGNTFRILKRVGILPLHSVYRRRAVHDKLQRAVDPSRRKSFHINLVVHGQRTCLPRRPRCSACVAQRICQMRGVATADTSAMQEAGNISALKLANSRNGARA